MTKENMEKNVEIEPGFVAPFGEDQAENDLILRFNKPYQFEGETYTELDLSGLEEVNGAQLMTANRFMLKKYPTINPATLEMSLEYCQFLAHQITGKPLEFFYQLPAAESIKLKSRIVGFLYAGD